jgi:hypothetical protein
MRGNREASGAEAVRLSGCVAGLKSGCEKAKAELQRLKPLGFCAVYVVAKATTHKDSRALTHAVKPVPPRSPLQTQILRTGETLALRKAMAIQPQRLPGSVNLNRPLQRPRLPRTIALKHYLWLAVVCVLAIPVLGLSEVKQVAVFDQDVQAFAISQDNHVVYAVERMKRIKKLIVEHDDFWVGDVDGKKRKIIDGDKFTPVPFAPDEEPSDPGDSKHPPLPHQHSYQVDTLTWSPDSKRIVVKMDTSELAQPRGSIVQQLDEQQTVRPNTILYLMDADGREISISGSKTATLSDAFNAAWLADGQTLVYLSKTDGGLSQINALRPADGKKRVLFEGFTFAAVAWDTKRNQAFAIEQNTRLVGPPKIMQLDLTAERVTELGSVEEYAGFLTVAPSAKKIAYFKDGDTLEVRDVVGSARPVVVRVAIGEFQWARDEQHILLKRGQPQQSNNLVWVGVYSGAFEPFFHGLEFHSFAIAPDGATVGVTEPGKRSLVMYRLQ